jgi:hypothetical protein
MPEVFIERLDIKKYIDLHQQYVEVWGIFSWRIRWQISVLGSRQTACTVLLFVVISFHVRLNLLSNCPWRTVFWNDKQMFTCNKHAHKNWFCTLDKRWSADEVPVVVAFQNKKCYTKLEKSAGILNFTDFFFWAVRLV